MVVFSHEFVSQKINQSNHQLIEKTQQKRGHLNWPLDSISEMVSSFVSDWQLVSGGIKSSETNPALSLNLAGQVINPSIHQSLLLEADISKTADPAANFKLEFSDQQQAIYFVSNNIPVVHLNQSIDLNELQWRIIKPNATVLSEAVPQWSAIQNLDAMVIRFKLINPTDLILKNIRVEQTHVKSWAASPQIDCQEIKPTAISCFVTNQMNFQQQQQKYKKVGQLIESRSLSNWPPVIWLLLGAVLPIFVLLLGSDRSIASLVVLVGVYAAVALFHQQWIAVYIDYVMWPVLIVFVGLVWRYRVSFKVTKNSAGPVWIVSIALSVVLLLGFSQGEVNYGFLRKLPLYFLWALLQQMLIGPLVSDLIYQKIKFSRWQVACIVGVLFSVIHSPNHVLMLATLVGGVAWSYAWLKYENLYANAFSHALLALVFYQVMPDAWLGSARIGVFF